MALRFARSLAKIVGILLLLRIFLSYLLTFVDARYPDPMDRLFHFVFNVKCIYWYIPDYWKEYALSPAWYAEGLALVLSILFTRTLARRSSWWASWAIAFVSVPIILTGGVNLVFRLSVGHWLGIDMWPVVWYQQLYAFAGGSLIAASCTHNTVSRHCPAREADEGHIARGRFGRQ